MRHVTIEPSAEQLAKLPAWAQKYIERLRQRVDEAALELRQVLDSQTPSAFYVERGPGCDQRQYVQSRSLSITLPGSPRPQMEDMEIRVTTGGHVILVTTSEMWLQPRAANAMTIIPPWARAKTP